MSTQLRRMMQSNVTIIRLDYNCISWEHIIYFQVNFLEKGYLVSSSSVIGYERDFVVKSPTELESCLCIISLYIFIEILL